MPPLFSFPSVATHVKWSELHWRQQLNMRGLRKSQELFLNTTVEPRTQFIGVSSWLWSSLVGCWENQIRLKAGYLQNSDIRLRIKGKLKPRFVQFLEKRAFLSFAAGNKIEPIESISGRIWAVIGPESWLPFSLSFLHPIYWQLSS